MNQNKIIWIIIFLIGLGVRSTELFHPIDTGSWRESDMASIARNYYRNGMDIIHPQVDWDGNGPGYTESEFPIYPYLIALSYKLFGLWEPIGRIISFLFSLGAMIIFFRLNRYLFNIKTAITVSFFFTLSPLLMLISNSIQPESIMFFFYIYAAFSFIRWIDNQSKKDYILTFIFTALTLLCKITAINIGILFVLLIIINKGWHTLLKPKVILLGVICVMPSIIWYTYCHRFYLLYGNSLGLSNEHAWVGWDFLTNRAFIEGIIKIELIYVWTFSGPLIILLAIIGTKIIKKQYIIIPICWLFAVGILYIIAARTTAETWANYYHIFSIPAASMLLGISIIEIYDKYYPIIKLRYNSSIHNSNIVRSGSIITILFLLIAFYVASCLQYLIQTKPSVFKTSEFYVFKEDLSNIIPKKSLILATGGFGKDDDNYPIAFNASYFFYWLDRKGYNICVEDQSVENVLSFKERGAVFYIAETWALQHKRDFEELMRKRYRVALECNGIILFEL